MLRTEEQKEICKKYSTMDDKGLVHCKDCPLVINIKYALCQANCHYDEDEEEWMSD